jgi:hypothetical protein
MIAWVASPAVVATEAKADGSVGFWDSIPFGSVTLLLVALAAAVALSLALGPMGRPRPVARRSGGLTRALARTQPGADSDEPPGEEP